MSPITRVHERDWPLFRKLYKAADSLPGERMTSLIRPRSIGGSPLVRDYLEGRGAAPDFYAGSPFLLDSFCDKLREVNTRFGRDDRARAAAALTPTTESARRRLARFVDEGGAMVTTGQQAGFLTGPLYTVYKTLSAVALARYLEAQLGVVVLPVFWSATEDHDWAEVNHAILLDRGGRLHRLSLTSEDERPLPMSEKVLDGELDFLCDEAMQVAGVNEHNSAYVRAIVDPFRRSGTRMGEAFGAAVLGLFQEVDLLIADAAGPALKQASLPVLETALRDSVEHESRLEARSEAIVAAGYGTQVAILEMGTNLFIRTESGRERLFRRAEGFGVRGRRLAWSSSELVDQLQREPGRFSPNVLLRPVVESSVFPTLAYVGGPGEIAYFAQAAALFEANGIAMPVVVPRFSGAVVEPAIEKRLAALHLSEDDLIQPREVLVERLALRAIPPEVTSSLKTIRTEWVGGFERLIEEAIGIDPTLAGALGGVRNRGLLEAGRAERKIVRALKRADHHTVAQLDRVLNTLRPLGAPQDRVLNPLPFLARYGGHFLREVQRSIDEHWRLPAQS